MAERVTRIRRTLFERESELAVVDEALSELSAARETGGEAPDRPRGSLLAFAGRAGLGKTTLLAEVRRRATAQGCTVLTARGGDQEQQVAFHVARQLVQPQLAGVSQAELRATLGSWYAIVGPALGLCAPQEGAPPDPQGLRDGLDWVLTHLAVQRAPMVLVLDDAHWADPESLSWLAAFAPRAEQLPLLLVVAYRPEELPEYADEFRGLPGRAGHRPLDLEPLSAPSIARLVRQTVGGHADDAFCRECWAVTAGNPFEAVELDREGRRPGPRTRRGRRPPPARPRRRGQGQRPRRPPGTPGHLHRPLRLGLRRTRHRDLPRRSRPTSRASATRRPPTPPTGCATPASSPARDRSSSSTR